MLDILKFGMSWKISQILCVAYLNILPVLVNDKKNISKYFHVDWRLDIFRFWLQSVAGVVILWSEDSSRGDQRSGDWRTKTASTPPASGLSSTQSGHSPPLQHITDRQTVSSCQANTHLQSRLPSPAHLLAAPWPCRSREMSVES